MNYLITGVSGSGKTTIARELHKRGFTAYDMDYTPGLSAWIERSTGKPKPGNEFASAEDWIDRYDWLWDGVFLKQLLAKSESEPAYFCGNSTNMEQFYDLFNKVFLLEVDDELIKDRLQASDRDHDYGRRPGELDVILNWYKSFQDKMKARGAIVIDAREPVDEIIDEITSQASEH